MSRLSVALRLARRDARRSKGRSALVVAMIALPVLGVGGADVLYRTFQLDSDQRATRVMGQADGVLEDTGVDRVEQYPGPYAGWNGDGTRAGKAPAPSTVLPAGTRVVPLDEDPEASVETAETTTAVSLVGLHLQDPLVRGLYVLRAGRPATGAGELVASTGLARRLGLHVGDRVTLAPGGVGTSARTVVGLVDVPNSVGARVVLVDAGQLPHVRTRRWLVDLPGRLTWSDVRRTNAQGFVLDPRADEVPGEPPVPAEVTKALDASTVTAVSLVVGMVLLEVVLLAGPAFAVGAKRRTRDLALLSASGAEASDVRASVLAGGVVLGGIGGVLGVLLGAVLARAVLPIVTRVNDQLPGPFELRPLELLGVALVGVVTALLAAVLPARAAARQDVVAALTGRRGTVRSLRRTPLLGVLAAAVGTAVALHGATQRDVNVILAGSATAELGLVATTPFLLGVVGRLGRVLPLGPRLALRDAARNRGRSAPAVSAVLAAVAGSVAVGTYLASTDRYAQQQYRASAPYGSTWVQLGGTEDAAAAERVLREQLPGAPVVRVRALGATPRPGQPNPPYVSLQLGCADGEVAPAVPCAGGSRPSPYGGEVLVGDAELVRRLTGVTATQAVRDVLARGGAVVPPGFLRKDGTVVVRVETARDDGSVGQVRRTVVPAVAADGPLDVTLLSPAAAARVGQPTHDAGVFAALTAPPSGRQEDRLRSALDRTEAAGALLQVERGYTSQYGAGLLALLVGSGVIVLGASSIATGLAAADGRADLSTLAAVGASPRTRRTLAGFQSATIAVLGTVLGAVSGLVPSIGMVLALNSAARQVGRDAYPLVLPWTNVLVTLLVVPALAALAAALLTRSRLPMVRRLA